MRRKRICVVGAGPSGLAATKTLVEAGLDAVCFDRSPMVGGQWVSDNPNGLSAAYRSLRTNTARRISRFSDFEMPADWPEFPPAAKVAEWLSSYAQHFNLPPRLQLGSEVIHAHPVGANGWMVRISRDGGGTSDEAFDGLVVASGMYWKPKRPDWTARFTGEVLHSQTYRSPSEPLELSERHVIVVGSGNTGCELAVEIARGGAASVTLSARRGTWILPKTINGVALSSQSSMSHPEDPVLPLYRLLPGAVRHKVFAYLSRRRLRKAFGPLQARYAELGLPAAPDHPLARRPTVAQDLLGALEAGEVTARGVIQSVDGREITFADGTALRADVLICATGYQLTFPFIDPDIADTSGDDLRLFCRTMSPIRHDLFFVGVGRPTGAFWPTAEAQSRLAAAAFAGRYVPPDQHEIERRARLAIADLAYNPALYGLELKEELKRGAARARRLSLRSG